MFYKGAKYLGVYIHKNLSRWADLQLTPLQHSTENQFARWEKYTLSWFGRIVVVKLKILPNILFKCQSVIMWVPLGMLKKLQITIN